MASDTFMGRGLAIGGSTGKHGELLSASPLGEELPAACPDVSMDVSQDAPAGAVRGVLCARMALGSHRPSGVLCSTMGSHQRY